MENKNLKTQIFQLSGYDWGDHCYWLFYHENKTINQFKKDVNFLLNKCHDEFFNDHFENPHLKGGYIKMDRYLKMVSQKLSELGYKEVETSKYVFNSGIIEKDTHQELKKIIGKENHKKIIDYNKNLYGF